MELLLFLIIGMVIGIFSGFFGVGGGFILTPLLLLSGFPTVTAIATSLLYTVGTSFSGVIAHLRLKNISFKVAILVGLSGIIATQIAHPFVLYLERKGFDTLLIPIFYLVLLAYFALSMLTKEKPQDHINNDVVGFSFIKYILVGFFGGLISTTLGVGGGFVLVPLLIGVLKIKPRLAVGTSLLSVFFIVSVGFVTYASGTPIDYTIGIALVIGALIGGQLGALVTTYYTNREIKRLLGALYVITWFSLVFELFQWKIAGLSIMAINSLILLIIFTIRFLSKNKITTI